MDNTDVVHATMQNVTPPRRSRTQHGHFTSGFRHLPLIKDARNYIMITEDILDTFKDQVVKSHKVNLNFTNVRVRSSRRGVGSRQHHESPLEERVRLIHSKAHTSLNLREKMRSRPVKVFVDDITQQFGISESDVASGSGHEIQRLVKRKHCTRQNETPCKRSLDSGDEEGGVPDDIIETVARANTVHVKHAPVLPEIRAAPCPLHTKRDRAKVGTEDSMERTLSPFRDSKTQKKHRLSHTIKNISMQQNATSQENVQTRGKKLDINVRIPEQFPSSKQPPLPKHMSSKDYVMTWLIHGSAPQGSNHFPEIIPSHSKTVGRTKPSPRRIDSVE